jgi:hypothetical protein
LLNPWVFHAANLAIHGLTALIVLAILRSTIRSDAVAWIGAAIFAIHPLHVEAVGLVSGTIDLLCGLFTCAAIWSLIRFRATARRHDFVAGTLCVLAACLSKPTGVVAPALAMVFDVTILCTPWRRSLVALSSWFGIAVLFVVIAAIVQPPRMIETTPLLARPFVAMDALGFYAMKIVWPARMGVDYGRTPARIIASGAIWWTWIVPTLFVIAAISTRRRSIIAAVLLIVVGVAPVLGLAPFTFQTISTVADHYMYLSMLGVALLVAAILSRSGAARWVGLVIVVALSVRSFVAAGAWANDDALFANALNVNPHSAFAHTNWGVARALHGNERGALDHFRRAVELDPDYAFGHSNLAGLLRARGRYAEAAQEFRELLRVYRKQRNFDPQLGVGLQRMIDQLDKLAAQASTQPRTQPTSRGAP